MEKKYEIEYLEIDSNKQYETLIETVINTCFETEKLENSNLYVSIILTNPSKIREINEQYRQIDKETDVLSFPMFEMDELENLKKEKSSADEVLGDIIISIERVKEQAEEYEHSFERELAYMLVHGFYHLCGYDHMIENDKKIMREKEENILNKLKITR